MSTQSETQTRAPSTIAGIEVKAYRTHRAGMEGDGFTATVYIDGKRALAVSNDGNGGENRYSLAGWRVGKNDTFEQAAERARKANQRCRELVDILTTRAKKVMADTDGVFFSPDVFIDLVSTLAEFEKHAIKNGYQLRTVVDASIPKMDYLSEREKEILRNPNQFQAPEFLN